MQLPVEIEQRILNYYLYSLTQREILERQCDLGKYHYYQYVRPLIYGSLVLGEYGGNLKNLLAWKLEMSSDIKPIVIHDLNKFMCQLTKGKIGQLVKYFEKMDDFTMRDSNHLSIIYQLILKYCKNLETIKYKFNNNDNCVYYLNNNFRLKNIFINCQYNLFHYSSRLATVPPVNKTFFQDLTSIDLNLLKNAYDFQITKDLENLQYFKLYTTFKRLPCLSAPTISTTSTNNSSSSSGLVKLLNTMRQTRRTRDYTMLYDEQEGGVCPAINIFLKNLINEKIYTFNKLHQLKFDNMSFNKRSIQLLMLTLMKRCSNFKSFEFNNVIEHLPLINEQQYFLQQVEEDEEEIEETRLDGNHNHTYYNNNNNNNTELMTRRRRRRRRRSSVLDTPVQSVFELIEWNKFCSLERLVLNADSCKPVINYILREFDTLSCSNTTTDTSIGININNNNNKNENKKSSKSKLEYLEVGFYDQEKYVNHAQYIYEMIGILNTSCNSGGVMGKLQELVINMNFEMHENNIENPKELIVNIVRNCPKSVTDLKITTKHQINMDAILNSTEIEEYFHENSVLNSIVINDFTITV